MSLCIQQRFERLFLAALLIPFAFGVAQGQATVFTYQGKLADNGAAANGNYDFEFKLFNTAAVGTGTQQGSTIQRLNINVANGIFTVSLDFGACATCFNGSDRFLEIAVKPAGGGAFTTLAPRQPITSTPYALQSANAKTSDGLSVTCVNCVTSSQIQSVAGSKVSGAIPVASVPAGNGNYIQNGTSQQAAANFNVSGNGTAGGTLSANVVNAATRYDINGGRVLSIAGTNNLSIGVGAGTANTGTENTFAGKNAGTANTAGSSNSFFGAFAGDSNTTADENAFFGTFAGQANTTGSGNSFFGTFVGNVNTTGGSNSFFGWAAGNKNTTGSSNSFYGASAGFSNTTGNNNAFFGLNAGTFNSSGSNNSIFGTGAGFANSTGFNNAFFGTDAGRVNTTGANNAFFGRSAGISNTTGSLNTFVGVGAGNDNTTAGSNSFVGANAGFNNTTGTENSFFGENAGFLNTSGEANSFFGKSAGAGTTGNAHNNSFFGHSAGRINQQGGSNSFFGKDAGAANTNGSFNTFVGIAAGNTNTTGTANTIIGEAADVALNNLTFATAIGAGAIVSFSNTIALGRSNGSDKVQIPGLGAGGNTSLCRNANDEISTCGSSLRYKTNIAPFRLGLSLINQLRPIAYDWKAGGEKDVGFGAEEVARINPLFVTYNAKGDAEGVKYDRLSTVFVNALKEQQAQIEAQQKQIEELKQIVCAIKPESAVCKKPNR